MFLSRCINNETSNDPRGISYTGSASCKQCHESIYNSYVTTSHFNSTQTSLINNITGSFTPGQNTFVVNPETKIVMEQRDSGLFQVLYVREKEQEIHRMDLTFGIKHAQTFNLLKPVPRFGPLTGSSPINLAESSANPLKI